MRRKTCSLNNRRLRALRNDPVYEAVMVDLYLMGAMEKETVEKLVGKVPDHLTGEESHTTEGKNGD